MRAILRLHCTGISIFIPPPESAGLVHKGTLAHGGQIQPLQEGDRVNSRQPSQAGTGVRECGEEAFIGGGRKEGQTQEGMGSVVATHAGS